MKVTQKAIIGFVAGGLLALGVASPAVAGAKHDGVCDGLDSGKINVKGSHELVTVEAPEGYLFDGYCVKAGSVKQGNGPHYVTLEVPVSSLTFGHPSGKDVSHYSLSWSPVEVDPVPEYTEVEYLPPQFVDVCGTENDEVQVPSDTEGVTYSVKWINDYTVVVTATVNEGFAFRYGDGALYSMVTENYVFDTEPCPSPVDPTPPVAENPVEVPADVETLAETGLDGITAAGWLVIGFGLLTAGVAALAMRRESGVRRKGTN